MVRLLATVYRTGITFVMLCAVALLVMPATASARQELRISPLILSVSGSPGDSLTENVTVTASGDEGIVVGFQHADFGFDNSSYAVQIIEDSADDTTRFSTRGWFSVGKDRYSLKAGESITVPLRISIPKNATSGTHLGAAFFRTIVQPDARRSSSVTTSARSGPLVFIDVSGGTDPRPHLDSFTTQRLTTGGPVSAHVHISNRGDRYFTYTGTLRLTGRGLDTKLEIPEKYVIPGQPRKVLAADDAPLKFRKSSSLALGRYTIHLKLKIQPTETTVEDTQTIWVIPRWAWIVLGIWLAAMTIAIAFTIRYISHRRLLRSVKKDQIEADDEAANENDIDDDGSSDDELFV